MSCYLRTIFNIFLSFSLFEFNYSFCIGSLLTFVHQKTMLNLEKSGLHLLRISVLHFLSPESVFSSSLLPRHASSPPSIPSLSPLMQALERTKARIAKEQLDRTQKRQKELVAQERRETLRVRHRKKELSERTLSLSRSLFEAKTEAIILRERTDRLSRSNSFLSCLCLLLCVFLAFSVVFPFVNLCDKRWLPEKSNGHQRQTMVGKAEASLQTESEVMSRDSSRKKKKPKCGRWHQSRAKQRQPN